MIARALRDGLTATVDGVFALFRDVSPWPALIAGGAIVALLMLGLFRGLTKSNELEKRRNIFLARALELVLYRHSLRANAISFVRLLAANVRYLACLALPFLAATLVVVPLLIQFEGWFERRPLAVGERTAVDVTLASDYPVDTTDVAIGLSPGLRLDSPIVRIASRNAVAFRIAAVEEGTGHMDVGVGSTAERADIPVGPRLCRVTPLRVQAGLSREFWHPGAPPLDAPSPITRIHVQYPERILEFGLYDASWLEAELVIIFMFALLLARPLGVSLF
jgi:hypothetical protein